MSAKETLAQARKLMSQKKYAQARKLLKGVDDPAADKLLEKIDDLETQGETGAGGGRGLPEPVQIILMALVFTLIFGGIGFVIASAIGIPTGASSEATIEVADAPTPASDSAVPASNNAAAATPQPAGTAVPCDAAAWWKTNGIPLGKFADFLTKMTQDTKPAEVKANKDALAVWKQGLDSTPPADCVGAAQQAMSNVAPLLDAVFGSYLSVVPDKERAQKKLAAMDALLAAVDAITPLNVATPTDKWLKAVADYSRADCTADRWYDETIVGRDYQSFNVTLNNVDFKAASGTDLQTTLVSLRGLRSAFANEKVPACLNEAKKHYLAAMDAGLNLLNSALNQDQSGEAAYLKTAGIELDTFANELGKFSPTLRTIASRLKTRK